MNKYNNYILGLVFGVMIGAFVPQACSPFKKAKPCKQCPQYTKEIGIMKKRISDDSIALKMYEEEYIMLWEENQRFSSMLAEIEGEEGGHEILKKLWNE